MNSVLQFDFVVNKDNNTIVVKRAFAAPLETVWSAWTEAEWLDQWWAPKPYKAETKTLNFEVGGFWLYAMVGPDGSKQYCRADYKSIDPLKSYSALDAFCDESGNDIQAFPNSLWTNKFVDQGETTLVDILIKYEDLKQLEQIIEMGFKEGFTAGMQNLDEVLVKK